MAYDRFDPRRGPREHNRHPDERFRERDSVREPVDRDGGDERGFFERAGDEIASWFGDEDADRRRRSDERLGGRDDDYGRDYETSRDRPGYRPITGDYGRSEGFGRTGRDSDRERNQGRDESRRTRVAGSSDRHHDPHYREWRQQQIDALDRDYDEYRREHQSKFESDFGTWRSNRQIKRQMLGQIREDMEILGNDEERVGTVDRVAGDRVILAKSDPEAGGARHSLSCSEIDRVEGNRVILGCSADEARNRWRDDSRERALFEREDQGEAGPHMLDRSFSGTYR